MIPAFTSWSNFFAMDGYVLHVWLAVATNIIPLMVLASHSALQHRAILCDAAQQRVRETRTRAAQAQWGMV